MILFHAGLSKFSGGFVGVDVFFVISGYLITKLLVEEIKQDRFSLTGFYLRRANRLLPALFVVLVFTSILAVILLSPSAFEAFGFSLVNVNTFTSNIYFLFNSGYFSADAIEQPLLHTWTLAVEEQFYLLFPMLLLLVGVTDQVKLLKGLIILMIISFGFSIYLQSNHYHYANFYLIFSRAWELLLGAAIVIVEKHVKKFRTTELIAPVLSWAGVLMILMACLTFSDQPPYPGWFTFVPVLGTAFVIIYVNEKSWLGRILCQKHLVFVGLMSYSLYLWHHPILSFINILSTGRPSLHSVVIGVALSFVLAALSWKYIESPFRGIKHKAKSHFLLFFCMSAMLLSFGLWGGLTGGAPHRFAAGDYIQSMEMSPLKEKCHAKESQYIAPDNACRFFVDNVTWAVIGDSHMAEPAYALARKLEPLNQGVLQLSFGNCPPAFGIPLISPVGCRQWTEDAIKLVVEDNNIKNVLIGYRYSKYLFGRNKPTYPTLPTSSPLNLFEVQDKVFDHDAAREAIWYGFRSMIIELLQSGKKVYIVYPVPELPVDIEVLIYPKSIFEVEGPAKAKHAVSAEYYFQRNEFILKKLATLKFGSNLIAIKPYELFCNAQFCSGILNKKSLYFDSNHLSLNGSDILLRNLDISAD